MTNIPIPPGRILILYSKAKTILPCFHSSKMRCWTWAGRKSYLILIWREPLTNPLGRSPRVFAPKHQRRSNPPGAVIQIPYDARGSTLRDEHKDTHNSMQNVSNQKKKKHKQTKQHFDNKKSVEVFSQIYYQNSVLSRLSFVRILLKQKSLWICRLLWLTT